jgi:hypothetical protein
MRKTLLFALTAIVATGAFAQQIRSPRPSPKATLTQTVGVTDITINYSRPGVKGRTIFGGLVPWDAVWRTGANEATTIAFSDDVTVGGQKLAKGTYSLHTIPGRDQWTVIFNSVADQWGSYSYDPAKDTARVTTKPSKGEFREWLTFEINDMTTDTATVNIRWADTVVPFTVNTDSTARTLAAYRNAMKPSWQVPYQAANFAFETKAASNDEINAWLDQSLKLNENIGNLWLKARILRAEGKNADAVRYAEMAIAKASPQQTDFANEIRRQSNEWKK